MENYESTKDLWKVFSILNKWVSSCSDAQSGGIMNDFVFSGIQLIILFNQWGERGDGLWKEALLHAFYIKVVM